MGQWLEDWDSVQLALGLHEYSLLKHQPHPPGYPIYTLMGKFFLFFLRDDRLVLTVMSAIFGALAALPLYLLVRKIFNKNLAFLASVILLLIPVEWLLSESALTDIVGLFFLILVGFLFFKYSEDKSKTLFVSFLAGLSIGVRFNEFPVILGLLFWVIIKQKNLRSAILQGLSFSLGVLLWLIPVILITGWNNFIYIYLDSGSYVVAHDLLLGQNHSLLGLIKLKLLQIVHLSNLGFSLPLGILFLVSLFWSLFQRQLYTKAWYQFSLIWLVSYSVLLLTFFNLELPRHLLPLTVPILLIIIYAISQLWKKTKLSLAIPLILILVLTYQSFSQVYRFQNSLPAMIAPVLYVKQNFSPKDTIVYSSFTLRSFSYYAPEFRTIDNKGDKSVITKDKTIILDHIDLKKDPALSTFEEVSSPFFSADKDIFPKVDSIQLHIMKYKKSG